MKVTFLSALCLFFNFATAQAAPTVVVLYTEAASEKGGEVENLQEVSQFAFDQYDLENSDKTSLHLVSVDDKDNPETARKVLSKMTGENKPIAIIGPLFSNVALGLKNYINEEKIPLLSVFATHNDLTKNSNFIFRICASNRRSVKAMAEFLIPEAEKNHLTIEAFKDLSDDFSIDLVDTFRLSVSSAKVDYNEVLFRGIPGIEHLQDLNAKVWNPTKKDILFLGTQDAVASHIIAAMETEPYLVATIDTVTFIPIIKHIKPQKTHIRLVQTSQWLPGKSDYSKKIEEAYQKQFHIPMTITTALTYDAAYTLAAAYHRAQKKSLPLVKALHDSTKIKGVTGNIIFGRDGERVFSDQFVKEDFIE